MKGNEYQKQALETKLYHEQEISPLFSKLLYLACGLNGESGELDEKLKKIIRDQNCQMTPQNLELIKKELADILWYLTAIVDELNLTLEEVMECSLVKIQDRINRGVLRGSGDER